MRFVRYAGTLIPGTLMAVFALAAFEASRDPLTWERPATYALTLASILLGLEALLKMGREPVREYPSLFLLTLIYQKVALLVLMAGVLLSSLEAITGLVVVPDYLLFGLLVASCSSILIVNLVLFFGRRRGWLEQEADPIPFRFLFRRSGRSRRR